MLRPVRGFPDVFADAASLRHIEDTLARVAQTYGCHEVRTPIVEPTALFTRSVEDLVASKELFAFETQRKSSVALRPEGTAGVIRALITGNKVSKHSKDERFFYSGPMFRYERPQKGRYRQFTQFGAEFVGNGSLLGHDIDCIAAGYHSLAALGVASHTMLHINCIGSRSTRKQYSDVLRDYLMERQSELSTASQNRLDAGKERVLRILDSKDPRDRTVLEDNIPRLYDYLDAKDKEHHAALLEALQCAGIPYQQDPFLVRGLDYYSGTTFEFVANGETAEAALGATQRTVLAGGRYDTLMEELGGPAVTGIGWAAGIERLVLLTRACSPHVPMVLPKARIVCLDPCTPVDAIQWAEQCRALGFSTQIVVSKNVKKEVSKSVSAGERACLVIGPQEAASGSVSVRHFESQQQKQCTSLMELEYVLKIA